MVFSLISPSGSGYGLVPESGVQDSCLHSDFDYVYKFSDTAKSLQWQLMAKPVSHGLHALCGGLQSATLW